MIPTTEAILSLSQAAKTIPTPRGRGVHPATLYRWAQRGLKVGAQRVKLQTIKVGGTRATSLEALARFFAALTERPDSTASCDLESGEDLDRQLDALGI